MCHERGGVIDDLIVYRLEQARYLLVINASHIPRDFEWMTSHSAAGCQWENVSNQTAGFAVQGPSAKQILTAAADLAGFHFRELPLANSDCWVARTGYTGEDGFEIFCPATDAVRVWDALLEMGRNFGLKPCGLGARDTLRLEMCYPLHGNDISESTTPIEAGLSRYVFFDKGAFIGREVLAAQRESGPSRKLVAFKMRDKSPPPRQHYPVTANGRVVGEVTSGTQSPSLGIGIGMAYVESGVAKAGSQIEIEVRGKPFAAVIETKPLLKKTK
jgi:aminomethyltransferase